MGVSFMPFLKIHTLLAKNYSKYLLKIYCRWLGIVKFKSSDMTPSLHFKIPQAIFAKPLPNKRSLWRINETLFSSKKPQTPQLIVFYIHIKRKGIVVLMPRHLSPPGHIQCLASDLWLVVLCNVAESESRQMLFASACSDIRHIYIYVLEEYIRYLRLPGTQKTLSFSVESGAKYF